MSAGRVDAAARVIHAAMLQGKQSAGSFAVALDSAQLLQSPETAAEQERLRLRVDEVERKYTFDTAELKRQLESARVDGQRLIRAEQRRAELEAVLSTHREDDQTEIERLRKQVAKLKADRADEHDEFAMALGRSNGTEWGDLVEFAAGAVSIEAKLRARVAELEAERHVTNEALDDAVQALRARGADASAEVGRDPIQLRWGLNDVEWCDDDNVIVLLSGPDGEPYTLELEPSQAAILRDDLAGPEGSAAFRAAWDTEQVGPLYGREEVARAHCERDARLDYPDGTRLVWRAFRDDDAQLFAVEAGEERPTGYTVTRQPLASEVVEEGGE